MISIYVIRFGSAITCSTLSWIADVNRAARLMLSNSGVYCTHKATEAARVTAGSNVGVR